MTLLFETSVLSSIINPRTRDVRLNRNHSGSRPNRAPDSETGIRESREGTFPFPAGPAKSGMGDLELGISGFEGESAANLPPTRQSSLRTMASAAAMPCENHAGTARGHCSTGSY